MKRIGSLFFITFLWGLFTFAAPAKLEVRLNPEDGLVQQGERFEIYLTVQSTEEFEAEIQDRDFPSQIRLEDASSLGQSFSTRAQLGSNGQMEYSKTVSQQYRFLFSAVQVGKFEFPPIQVKVDGQLISSSTIKMEVLAAGAKPRPQRQQQQPGNPFGDDEDDPFSQFLREKNKMLEEMQRQMGRRGGGGINPFGQQDQIPKRQMDINPRDPFFVHLDVDKETAYEGEQVTANWYLYTKTNIISLDRVKFPDLKGFWKEIIQEIPQLSFSPEIVNGEMYQKALIASHALFPIKPGQSVIDEFKIKSKLRSGSAFSGGVSEATRSSRRQVIDVLPVPLENRPNTFSGAVGQFQIQTHLEGVSFPAQQPFTVRIRFEGLGNAKLIELPPIQWPTSFEVFDTKSDAKFAVDGTSYKEFEVLVIPRQEGKFQLPGIQFSYFDPQKKVYETKSTEPIELDITKSLGGNSFIGKNSGLDADKKKAIEALVQPILEWPQTYFYSLIGYSTWTEARWSVFAAVSGLSLFGFIIFLMIELTKIVRKPSLRTQLLLRISELKKSLSSKNERRTVTQALNVIYILLAAMAQEKSADQEWQSLIDKVPINLRDKFEKRLSVLFDYFQIIGFAPESAKTMTLASKKISDAVQELESVAHDILGDLPKEQE